MDLLIFLLVVAVIVSIIIAICNYIPWPPPLGWLRWAIPCVALLFALILMLQKLGLVA